MKWQKRPFSRATPLCHGLLVACPQEAAAQTAAGQIAAATGGRVVDHVACPALAKAKQPVLLLGNLANNRQVAWLYRQHLCFTDLTYPGPGGYELRTLVDPFGTGHNVLHLGYSNTEGLQKGLGRLLGLLEEKPPKAVPWLCAVQATATPYFWQQAAYYKAVKLDYESPPAYYSQPIDQKGALAYFTADEEVLAEYHAAFERVLLKTPNREDEHLRLKARVFVWRLLEATGMLEDWLYPQSAAWFHAWVTGPEGLAMIDKDIYQTDGYPRQNHGLLPALGIRCLHVFYTTHYPQLKGLRRWKTLADKVFEPYTTGSWKPICDGLCHGWAMAQPALVEYALMFDDGYVRSGGLKKAAECALAVTNNTGWMPESGDSSLLWAQNGTLLATAAHLYGDGRFLHAKNMAPAWRRGNVDWAVWLERGFDTGMAPQLPQNAPGWAVVPMDPLVYNAQKALPQKAAGPWGAFTCPPAVPLRQAFDKISWRGGYGPQDEYLLLDGLGGGSHAYDDALSIVDYQRFGVDFLVAADGLLASEAENHSMVTVCQNGQPRPIPSFAALQSAPRQAKDGSYRLRATLPDVGGCDWQRELYILPGRFVAVQDTVTARQAGDYTICCRWRVPGRARLQKGGALVQRRKAPNGQAVHFRLLGACSRPAHRGMVQRPLADPGIFTRQEPDKEAFEYLQKKTFFAQRYGLGPQDNLISSLERCACGPLKAGQQVVFTHVFYASLRPTPARLLNTNGKLTVVFDGIPCPLPFAAHPFARQPRSVQAPAEPAAAVAQFESAVTAFCSTPDGTGFFGLQNGQVYRQAVGGGTAPFFETEGPVHSLLAMDGRLYVSFSVQSLACVDARGRQVWRCEIAREPTLYPWWELPHPTAVALGRLPHKGGFCLGAACGDDSLKYICPGTGALLQSVYFRIGVPGLLRSADVNGDGRPETLAASGGLGCQSTVRVLNDVGEELAAFGDEGWISTVTALEVLEVESAPALGVGVNHRSNLKLFAFDESGQAQPLLDVGVLGAVSATTWWQTQGLYLGGTSEGLVLAYGLGGGQRWLSRHQSGICRLWVAGEVLHVLEQNGLLSQLDGGGAVLHRCQLEPGCRWQAWQGKLLGIKEGRALLYDVPLPGNDKQAR